MKFSEKYPTAIHGEHHKVGSMEVEFVDGISPLPCRACGTLTNWTEIDGIYMVCSEECVTHIENEKIEYDKNCMKIEGKMTDGERAVEHWDNLDKQHAKGGVTMVCKTCGGPLPEDVELEHPESPDAHYRFKDWLFCSEECRNDFKECQCHVCGADMTDGINGGCISCGWTNE